MVTKASQRFEKATAQFHSKRIQLYEHWLQVDTFWINITAWTKIRYLVQSNGVKEVGEEQVTMVEDVTEDKIYQIGTADACFFSNLETSEAIVDSGASRTIVGEEIWKEWMENMRASDAKLIKNDNVMAMRSGPAMR